MRAIFRLFLCKCPHPASSYLSLADHKKPKRKNQRDSFSYTMLRLLPKIPSVLLEGLQLFGRQTINKEK